MEEFKVGDWVKNTSSQKVFQIKEDWEAVSCESAMQIELWHPKEGEWCWWTNGGKRYSPTLCKATARKDGKMVAVDGFGIMTQFLFCEPFIGELPTFLKDNA